MKNYSNSSRWCLWQKIYNVYNFFWQTTSPRPVSLSLDSSFEKSEFWIYLFFFIFVDNKLSAEKNVCERLFLSSSSHYFYCFPKKTKCSFVFFFVLFKLRWRTINWDRQTHYKDVFLIEILTFFLFFIAFLLLLHYFVTYVYQSH